MLFESEHERNRNIVWLKLDLQFESTSGNNLLLCAAALGALVCY